MTRLDIGKLPYRPCVGVMLVNKAGLVFAAQRIDNPGPAWQMPQGGIDKGESPLAAARRELFEETSVPVEAVALLAKSRDWMRYDLPVDLVPQIWNGKYRGQEQKWFLMRLIGPDTLINIATGTPEFSSWRWVDPSELPSLIVPFKRELYRKVLAEFAPLI